MKLIDITGQTFGRLKVLKKGPFAKNGGSLWVCACECGETAVINSSNLRSGSTRSCGCLALEWASCMGSNKEFVAKRISKTTRHGHKRVGRASAEYKTWLRMKARCYTPSNKDYKNWGERGIKVCDRWLHSFESFLADMGNKPTPEHQIDRLNSNSDYSIQNCRWVTPQIQGAENRRSLLPVAIDGLEFHSLKAACRHFCMPYAQVHSRIKTGIPFEIALKAPLWSLKSRRTKASYLPKNRR